MDTALSHFFSRLRGPGIAWTQHYLLFQSTKRTRNSMDTTTTNGSTVQDWRNGKSGAVKGHTMGFRRSYRLFCRGHSNALRTMKERETFDPAPARTLALSLSLVRKVTRTISIHGRVKYARASRNEKTREHKKPLAAAA